MANEPAGTSDDQDLLDEVFEGANPNPARVGCPSQDTLRALARHARPLSDPAYEHLAACPECYREVRAYQRRRRRAPTLGTLAASVLGLVIMGVWYFVGMRPPQPTRQQPVESASVRVEVDLRQYRVARADDASSPTAPPLDLARQHLRLRILLPVGAASGTYDLEIRDAVHRPSASANGIARLEHHTMVLDALLDLRALAPGRYQLALRREGESWHVYPARLT